MVLPKILVPAALLAALLAGCNKTEAPPEPRTSGAQTGAQPEGTATVPGAASPSTAASTVPPSTSGSPGPAGQAAQSQANPSTLSQSQENTSMPMEGQANNYSPAGPPSKPSSGTGEADAKGEGSK